MCASKRTTVGVGGGMSIDVVAEGGEVGLYLWNQHKKTVAYLATLTLCGSTLIDIDQGCLTVMKKMLEQEEDES